MNWTLFFQTHGQSLIVGLEREEAIHHLGFKRTGSLIRDALKSAVNGAIRRGLLEYDGQLIRRVRTFGR